MAKTISDMKKKIVIDMIFVYDYFMEKRMNFKKT